MKKPDVYNPQVIVSNFYNGKPYYGILYYDVDDREWHEGYGSYYLDYVIEWLNNDLNIISKDIEFIPRDRGNYGIEKAIIKKAYPNYSDKEVEAYIKGYEEKELEIRDKANEDKAKETGLKLMPTEVKGCLDIYNQIDKFVWSLRLTQDKYNGIMTAIAKEMDIIGYLG